MTPLLPKEQLDREFMEQEVIAAAELLRSAGRTCVPPVDPTDEVPEAAAGQVWMAPNPRVEHRTVLSVGVHQRVGGHMSVRYASRTRKGWCVHVLSWAEWAKKSGARPQP